MPSNPFCFNLSQGKCQIFDFRMCMVRKKQFMSQEQRNEHNAKMEEIEQKLQAYRKSDRHETYDEGLKDWLPEGQKPHAEGSSYTFLCAMLKKFLEEKLSEDNRQALKLARDNFEHYCEMKERT
jgi:hypothetical protein